MENFQAYRSCLAHSCREESFRPRLIAHDLHPAYSTTRLAGLLAEKKFAGADTIGIQHHHAHIAAVMAERGSNGPVLGIAWDGTGYRKDGTIGGGEFLRASLASCRTLARLQPFPLPGGDRAVRDPWRMAFSYLYGVMGEACLHLPIEFSRKLKGENIPMIVRMITQKINSPPTSSMGRLFDGAAALIGLVWKNARPAEPAIALEEISQSRRQSSYPFTLKKSPRPFIIEPGPLFSGIIEDLSNRVPPAIISARFHATVIKIGKEVASILSGQTGIKETVFSGGVFQNRIVRGGLAEELRKAGLTVILSGVIPAHDGGIAFGQAAVAAGIAANQ